MMRIRDVYGLKHVTHRYHPDFGIGDVVLIRQKDAFGMRTRDKVLVSWKNGIRAFYPAADLRRPVKQDI